MRQMEKFNRRRELLKKKREEALASIEAEMIAIEKEEKAAFEKSVKPLAAKISTVAGEVATRFFKDNPDAVRDFRFRKKEAVDALDACIENYVKDVIRKEAEALAKSEPEVAAKEPEEVAQAAS